MKITQKDIKTNISKYELNKEDSQLLTLSLKKKSEDMGSQIDTKISIEQSKVNAKIESLEEKIREYKASIKNSSKHIKDLIIDNTINDIAKVIGIKLVSINEEKHIVDNNTKTEEQLKEKNIQSNIENKINTPQYDNSPFQLNTKEHYNN